MLIHKKLAVLFSPYWNKSARTRLEGGYILLANIGLQGAVYVATLPKSNQTQVSDWDTYMPIVIPMLTNTAQILMFTKLQCDVAAALQESMVQRLFVGNPSVNEDGCKNIGLVQILADEETAKDIENIGTHIDGAAMFCALGGSLVNIAPMVFYWRAAYLSLPAARPVLYAATSLIGLICLMIKYLDSGFMKSQEVTIQQDMDWQTKMWQNLRHNDAVIGGSYQSAEANALNTIITNKKAGMLKYSGYLGGLIVMHSILGLALINLVRAAVGSFYPQLKGTPSLDSFSLEMNLFASALLNIFSSITQNYSRTALGLEKLYSIDQLLQALDELAANPYLSLEYGQRFDNPNEVMRFEKFTLAIPRDLHTQKFASIRQKIETALTSTGANFVFHAADFAFAAAELRRIYGASGVGKSTLFKAIHGIWPYASGKIRFACARNEIYAMPQDQMFVKGTLLLNVFYPEPVPENFKDSIQEKQLHATMRLIGLEQEIARLDEDKDWSSPDLSQGLKKRFNFLRMYVKITSGKHPRPKVILLDEMTSGVDGDNAGFLEGLLRKLRRDFPQILVLFIKHNEEQHPHQFCSEQLEFVQSDPDFSRGLQDCQTVNLTRTSRNISAADLPTSFAYETPVNVGNRRPQIFFGALANFIKGFTTKTEDAQDVDLEQGTELTTSLLSAGLGAAMPYL